MIRNGEVARCTGLYFCQLYCIRILSLNPVGCLFLGLQSSVGINVMQSTLFTFALSGVENYREEQPLNGRVVKTYSNA